jgi:hypothetical protein
MPALYGRQDACRYIPQCLVDREHNGTGFDGPLNHAFEQTRRATESRRRLAHVMRCENEPAVGARIGIYGLLDCGKVFPALLNKKGLQII